MRESPQTPPSEAPDGESPQAADLTPELPWPDAWYRYRRRGRVRAVAFIPISLLLTAMGAGIILYPLPLGSRGTGVFLLVFGVATLTACPTCVITRRTDRAAAGTDPATGEPGLALPDSRVLLAVAVIVQMSLAVAGLVGGTLHAVSVVAAEAWGTLWMAALMLLSGVGFAFTSPFAIDRLARPFLLTLTPMGVSFRQRSAVTSLPWNAIDRVEAREPRAGRGQQQHVALFAPSGSARRVGTLPRSIRKANSRFGAELAIHVRLMAIDPAAVFYAVRYYHEHPEARAELGTQAAVDRVRRKDLLPEGTPDEAGRG